VVSRMNWLLDVKGCKVGWDKSLHRDCPRSHHV
jgi:hypothetical protein